MNFRLALVASCTLFVGAVSQAQVLNLWWEAQNQTASVGQTVTLTVFANSSGPGSLVLSDANLTIGWDPSALTNVTPTTMTETAPWDISYWSPGVTVNTSVTDGDAQRELLGLLPPDQPVAPAGVMRDPTNRIKVTTFSFLVNSTAPTSIKLWNNFNGGVTRFFKGNFEIGTWDLNFESGNYSEATINVVPEPASMAALGLGALALLRRRRKS